MRRDGRKQLRARRGPVLLKRQWRSQNMVAVLAGSGHCCASANEKPIRSLLHPAFRDTNLSLSVHRHQWPTRY